MTQGGPDAREAGLMPIERYTVGRVAPSAPTRRLIG